MKHVTKCDDEVPIGQIISQTNKSTMQSSPALEKYRLVVFEQDAVESVITQCRLQGLTTVFSNKDAAYATKASGGGSRVKVRTFQSLKRNEVHVQWWYSAGGVRFRLTVQATSLPKTKLGIVNVVNTFKRLEKERLERERLEREKSRDLPASPAEMAENATAIAIRTQEMLQRSNDLLDKQTKSLQLVHEKMQHLTTKMEEMEQKMNAQDLLIAKLRRNPLSPVGAERGFWTLWGGDLGDGQGS